MHNIVYQGLRFVLYSPIYLFTTVAPGSDETTKNVYSVSDVQEKVPDLSPGESQPPTYPDEQQPSDDGMNFMSLLSIVQLKALLHTLLTESMCKQRKS